NINLDWGKCRKLFSRSFLLLFRRVSLRRGGSTHREKPKEEKSNMKPQNLIHILILTVCLAFSPKVQAVSPPPDGCYPGFTTAEGCNALQFLGAGAGNTGVGWYSLYLVGGGNSNSGVGAGQLGLNTADSNTAVGAAAVLLNTTGTEKTADGTDAVV